MVEILLLSVLIEATIRFLKAKLRVLQEELDRVVAESNNKVHIPSLPIRCVKVHTSVLLLKIAKSVLFKKTELTHKTSESLAEAQHLNMSNIGLGYVHAD